MRRFTRLTMVASSAATAASCLLALGSALPASAATAHAVPSVKITAATSSSCTPGVHTGTYTNAYGYVTEKAYFTTTTCGDSLQAYIYCYNSKGWVATFWGKVDSYVGTGTASFAACNSSYPYYDGIAGAYVF